MLRLYDFAFFLKFQICYQINSKDDIAKQGFTCFTWNGKVVLPIIDCAFVVERV